MKKCNKCLVEKDESCFYKSPVYKDGLTTRCKQCTIEYDKYLKSKYRELPSNGLKTCSHCDIEKSIDEFHKKNKNKDGLRSECKKCTRKQEKQYRLKKPNSEIARRLKNKYGLEYEEYIKLTEKQSNKCAICNKEIRLNVDHCHKTGKVRGLLCHNCNAGIGMFFDDINIIENAKRYLINNE